MEKYNNCMILRLLGDKKANKTENMAGGEGCCLHWSEVRAISTLPFQGGVILRTFVPDSGFGTYAMLTTMVILP